MQTARITVMQPENGAVAQFALCVQRMRLITARKTCTADVCSSTQAISAPSMISTHCELAQSSVQPDVSQIDYKLTVMDMK